MVGSSILCIQPMIRLLYTDLSLQIRRLQVSNMLLYLNIMHEQDDCEDILNKPMFDQEPSTRIPPLIAAQEALLRIQARFDPEAAEYYGSRSEVRKLNFDRSRSGAGR